MGEKHDLEDAFDELAQATSELKGFLSELRDALSAEPPVEDASSEPKDEE